MAIIRAAGGLVWRVGRDGRRRVAVIHRPHREDWSLPKGKLKDGEHWEEAALREVFEETGCRTRIASFAGCVHYVPKRTPKVVLYWNMELVKEGPLLALDEVDRVVWLTRGEALRRLDHDAEREVLLEALELRHFEPPPEPALEPRRPARRAPAVARREPAAPSEPAPAAAAEERPAAAQPSAQDQVPGHEELQPRPPETEAPEPPETEEVEPAAAFYAEAASGAPESPPPLRLDLAPRPSSSRLLRVAAGAAAMAASGLAAHWLAPPGALPFVLAAAAIGWLAAVVAAAQPRAGRG